MSDATPTLPLRAPAAKKCIPIPRKQTNGATPVMILQENLSRVAAIIREANTEPGNIYYLGGAGERKPGGTVAANFFGLPMLAGEVLTVETTDAIWLIKSGGGADTGITGVELVADEPQR